MPLVLAGARAEGAADDEEEEEDEEAAAASEAVSASGLRSPCIVELVSRGLVVVLLLPPPLLLVADVEADGSSSSEIVALVRFKKSVGQGAMVGK